MACVRVCGVFITVIYLHDLLVVNSTGNLVWLAWLLFYQGHGLCYTDPPLGDTTVGAMLNKMADTQQDH